jgi:hypothetical protein
MSTRSAHHTLPNRRLLVLELVLGLLMSSSFLSLEFSDLGLLAIKTRLLLLLLGLGLGLLLVLGCLLLESLLLGLWRLGRCVAHRVRCTTSCCRCGFLDLRTGLLDLGCDARSSALGMEIVIQAVEPVLHVLITAESVHQQQTAGEPRRSVKA